MRILALHNDSLLMPFAQTRAEIQSSDVEEMPPIILSQGTVNGEQILQELADARIRLGFLPPPVKGEEDSVPVTNPIGSPENTLHTQTAPSDGMSPAAS